MHQPREIFFGIGDRLRPVVIVVGGGRRLAVCIGDGSAVTTLVVAVVGLAALRVDLLDQPPGIVVFPGPHPAERINMLDQPPLRVVFTMLGIVCAFARWVYGEQIAFVVIVIGCGVGDTI